MFFEEQTKETLDKERQVQIAKEKEAEKNKLSSAEQSMKAEKCDDCGHANSLVFK